jgi:hypothetical protein
MSNLEIEEKNKLNFLSVIKKYKIIIFIAAAIIFFLVAFNIGISSAKINLEKEKVSYDELVSKISAKEKELLNINEKSEAKTTELASLEDKFDDRKQEFDEAIKLTENKNDIIREITSLSGELSAKKTEIETVNAEIETKKGELASVTGQIQEKKEAPKQLPAGQLLVGKDIPEGRYKITPIGRGSNFVVYDASGSLVTNTILSSVPDHGVSEYVTILSDGEIIDSSTPAKYTPIK